MKVGILGSGDVGQVLGAGFAALGHEVRMGTRDPQGDKVRAWVAKTGGLASAGTFAESAAFGEIAVLATAWSGTESAIKLADPKNLVGKVVIDVTNPLVFHPDKMPTLAVAGNDSAGEQVQRWLSASRVVKAYNTVGNPHMVNPRFQGGPPDMFLCGNDEGAKKHVAEICKAFGWLAIDLGGIEASRYLEPLAMVWIWHFIRTKSGDHAFKLLRK